MTEVKSVRIPDEIMTAIRDRARREQLDESTTIRQLVTLGLREEACQRYAQGDITLREAASIANTTLREMLDLLNARGIQGNVSLQQQRDALNHTKDALQEDQAEAADT